LNGFGVFMAQVRVRQAILRQVEGAALEIAINAQDYCIT
jgi:hypothetical protein